MWSSNGKGAIKGACHKVPDNLAIPSRLFPPFLSVDTSRTMGKSWQSDDHKAFFNLHIKSYSSSYDEGKLKEFWPKIMGEWFERWPLSKPLTKIIKKEETIEKARKVWKVKMTEVSIRQRHLVWTRAHRAIAGKEGLQEEGCRGFTVEPATPPP